MCINSFKHARFWYAGIDNMFLVVINTAADNLQGSRHQISLHVVWGLIPRP